MNRLMSSVNASPSCAEEMVKLPLASRSNEIGRGYTVVQSFALDARVARQQQLVLMPAWVGNCRFSSKVLYSSSPGTRATFSFRRCGVDRRFEFALRLRASTVAYHRPQSASLISLSGTSMNTLNLRQQWPRLLRTSDYAMAVVSVAVGVVVAELITRLLHAEPIASSMLCAVIFAAWLGGFGPALLAITLGLFAFHYYLVPPINTFTWKQHLFFIGIEEVPRLILFAITSVLFTLVISAQRKATEALRDSSDDLRAAIERQKRIEAALLQSEMYLTEAQGLSHTGSFGWNVTGREIVWSDETFRIFQLDRAKRPTLEFIIQRTHPDDRAAVQETIEDASSNGKDFDHEHRLLMPDGSVKYVHAVARAARDASGSVKFVGAVTDITAAKETEQKLRHSEDHLRLVIDTIPTLLWRAGPDGVPDFLNQPALDYTGLTLDQAEKGWPRAFHPDDKKGMLVTWGAIRESGMRGELEARLRRFDGEYRWFLFRAEPLRDDLGNIVKWYGSSTDIEDRKLAEVSLRKSEQRFRDYAETASDWLWETGPDHRIISISDHLNADGLVPSPVTGLARWDIAADTESEPEKWRLHRAMHDARQPFRDFVYRTSNESGSPVYVRTSGKPFFDATGNFLGYRGTGTDITATIRADHAEQALRKAQAELAQVMRVTTLGELTASIAHEVNQPIAATVTSAEAGLRFLGAQAVDLNEVRHILEDIVKAGIRAGEVIGRIRDLVKKAPPRRDRWEINGAIRELVEITHGEAVENSVSVRTELADGIPHVQGDRVQLQQVTLNLIINAIQAMSGSGEGARELLISTSKAESGAVLVKVRDSGPGLAPATRERVFESFYTTKPSGMGMGLSICRSIIEAHGGRLWASANDPRGATFQFTVPTVEASSPQFTTTS